MKISVIIPTFNGGQFLEEALNGLLVQTSPIHEAILVDDGPTDNTRKIIDNFKSKLPIKAFYKEKSGNWVAATNVGLTHASGDYISILHQDDLWLPNRVAVLTEILRTHPELNVIVHPSWFIGPNGKTVGTWNLPFGNKQRPIASVEILNKLIIQNFISMPAPLISRRALETIGGLDETLWYTADWKLWLSLARLEKWIYHPLPLTCFRIHRNSQTISGGQSVQSYAEQLHNVQDPLLDGFFGKKTRTLARFNTEVNLALIHILFSQPYQWFGLVLKFIALGPYGWHQFFSISRIHERLTARLRLGKNLIRTRHSVIESSDPFSRDR